jgi:predicted nucleic acid binding AN1-type Zn finger protein
MDRSTLARCAAPGCRKKLHLNPFRCRCNKDFCLTHRMPEEHICEFDYKSAGIVELKKANPVVVSDKIIRI